MIEINKAHPSQRIIELGCGENRHPQADVAVDCRPLEGVDFVCDFEEPLPIADEDFDVVYSSFAIEHISYPKTRQFISEVFRILKMGGAVVMAMPNTEEQFEWVRTHPNGWDGKDFFTSVSELLFGSQSYTDNYHKAYFDPVTVGKLFKEAGFDNIVIHPYGERKTDMVVEAHKAAPKEPINLSRPAASHPEAHQSEDLSVKLATQPEAEKIDPKASQSHQKARNDLVMPRAEMFDKHYFHGGAKVGGYANEGYRDFPVHEITFRHVMARKPKSVLELAPARGGIMKRLQDAGVRACGLEISQHCWMTRWCDGIICKDICETPWPFKDKEFDLLTSVALMEHIPEEFLSRVIAEMARVSERCLHGIDFGENDNGFDKTHVSLFTKDKWNSLFSQHFSPGTYEILDKEELERGDFPKEVLEGDGKVKLQLGSFISMFHHGWMNLDIHDLGAWAAQNKYRYQRHDLRQGVPYGTESVDLLFSSHTLEHLTYSEGKSLLKECRRVLKPEGALRLTLPDAGLLMRLYAEGKDFSEFSHINDGCEEAPTPAGKLWALLHEGHHSCYDVGTLFQVLQEVGFQPYNVGFRNYQTAAGMQIVKETIEGLPCISLFVEAVPRTS